MEDLEKRITKIETHELWDGTFMPTPDYIVRDVSTGKNYVYASDGHMRLPNFDFSDLENAYGIDVEKSLSHAKIELVEKKVLDTTKSERKTE
jgi:hypothetical protein